MSRNKLGVAVSFLQVSFGLSAVPRGGLVAALSLSLSLSLGAAVERGTSERPSVSVWWVFTPASRWLTPFSTTDILPWPICAPVSKTTAI